MNHIARWGCCLALLTFLSAQMDAATAKRHHKKHYRRAVAAASTTKTTATRAAVIHSSRSARVQPVSVRHRRGRGRHVFASPWTEPTYADSTIGDSVDGEDLVIRKAAVDALGPYNGTIVVADPTTGRILSIVNQKLAMKGAYQPCSTVKVMVSLASLNEGVVTPEERVRLTRRASVDMTFALAKSNNMYFAHLGQELGFDRVEKYGKLFGLGEKAGLDVAGEEPGFLASEVPASGVGMMTSFGDGIRITPLELTSIISSVANGGTMYYLQYPRTQEQIDRFVPRIKRDLGIGNLIGEIKPGMMGAVEYGTAVRANFDPNEPVFGKTGTCTDTVQPGVHLGWFGSFTEVNNKKLTVVVLLTGGRGVSGPIASGIGGQVYRNLSQSGYFGAQQPANVPLVPAALIGTANAFR